MSTEICAFRFKHSNCMGFPKRQGGQKGPGMCLQLARPIFFRNPGRRSHGKSRLTASDNLYGEKLVKIPAPHFVVFYNGVSAYPEKEELRLSDSFQIQEGSPNLELKVEVLNINEGFNEDLKEQCRTLAEYMHYVDKVRMYAKDMPIDEAVGKAVDECIQQGILREFLLRNKAEVVRMSIYEYDEESTRSAIRDTAYERGVEDGELKGETKGKREAILCLLEEIGSVPDELRKVIMEEADKEVLVDWLKAAARAENLEEFMGEMDRGTTLP